MRKKTLTAAAVFLTATVALSQKAKTYFGGQVGIVSDRYELVDNGGGLQNVRFLNGIWGINLRQDFNRFFLETGIIRKEYSQGVVFKIEGRGHGSSSGTQAWLIPLRLGTTINLHKQKIYLVPVIGYSHSIHSGYGSGSRRGSGGVILRGPGGEDSARYNLASRYDFAKTFPLLQTGMGLEFILFKRALLSLSANQYTGFKKISRQDITYSVNNAPEQTATAFSKGEFFSVELGLKYPVSNLWTKPKDRPPVHPQSQTLIGINVNSEIYSGAFRPAIGVTLERQMTKHSGVETGLYYNTKLSKGTMTYTDASGTRSYAYTVAERQATVPVLYKYYSRVINFSAGPTVGFNVGWKQKEDELPFRINSYHVTPKVRVGSLVKVSKVVSLSERFVLEPEVRFSPSVRQVGLGIGLAGKYRF